MIKIVLWDLDGTLTNFAKTESQGIQNCFQIFKLGECTETMLDQYIKINADYWKALERKEISKPDLLIKRFEDFFALYHIKCDPVEFNKIYQEQLRENAVLNDGVMQVINQFDELHIPQYIVTNGIIESQYRKLEKVGLANRFKKVFISDEIGHDKPDIEFFKPVLKEITSSYPNVTKEEIMIIGDSITSDIQGGINAGIKTCWYNPSHSTSNLHYDIETDQLENIPNFIKNL